MEKPKEEGNLREVIWGVQSGPLAARLIFHKFEKHTRGSRCVNLNFSAPVRQSRVFLEGKEAAWKGHWAYGAEFRTTFFPPFFILPVVGNTRLAEMPFLLLIGDFQSFCFGSCCPRRSSLKKLRRSLLWGRNWSYADINTLCNLISKMNRLSRNSSVESFSQKSRNNFRYWKQLVLNKSKQWDI